MDDTISRQAALDAIIGYHGVVDKSVAKRILIQLPSAHIAKIVSAILKTVEQRGKPWINISKPLEVWGLPMKAQRLRTV